MNSITAIRIGATPDFRNSAVVGLTLTGTVIAGWWLAPQYGMNLLFVVLAGVGVMVVFARPVVGVFLLVATIPLQDIFVLEDAFLLGGRVTWVRVIGIATLSAWALQKLIRRESFAPILSANLLIPALLFVLFAYASLLWAKEFSDGTRGVLSLAQLLILTVLVVGVINSERRVEWVIRFLVLGAIIAAALTISQSFISGDARAGDGITGRVNETATALVVMLPLGFYLLRTSGSLLWRLLGLTFVALAPLAVVLTFSRTSFLLMPVILGLVVWEMSKDGNKNRLRIALVLLVLGVILAAVVPWDRVLARGGTIAPEIQGETGSARMQSWLAGVGMFSDYPLLGVGYGNYRHNFLTRYQFAVPQKYIGKIYTTLRSPHSSFVALISEVGLVGTALWAWLLLVAFLNIRESWTTSARSHHRRQEILAKAIFHSLLVYMLYGFVTVTIGDKLLWVLLSLTVVLRGLTLRYAEHSRVSYQR